jgi:endonuclease-8
VPEGDTVWLAARTLNSALAGRVLTSTDFRVPQLATRDLAGQTVAEVVSRGKHLLIRIGDDVTLHTHFRMDGAWRLYRRGERWSGGPGWQVRLVLETDDWVAVGYRLPVIDLVARADERSLVGHLGPDLLADDWGVESVAEAVRRLLARPDREVGLALLDQRNMAGLGNLYRTEVCFLRGLSPWAALREVPDVNALVDLSHRLLFANRLSHHQVTTGDRRRGREHWVFERSNQPCRRCGTSIRSAEQGEPPYQRITYWCPHCQPGPGPS